MACFAGLISLASDGNFNFYLTGLAACLAAGLRNGNHLIGRSEQRVGRRRKWPAKQKARAENFHELVQGYESCLPPMPHDAVALESGIGGFGIRRKSFVTVRFFQF
jgi:hypothetical protein